MFRKDSPFFRDRRDIGGVSGNEAFGSIPLLASRRMEYILKPRRDARSRRRKESFSRPRGETLTGITRVRNERTGEVKYDKSWLTRAFSSTRGRLSVCEPLKWPRSERRSRYICITTSPSVKRVLRTITKPQQAVNPQSNLRRVACVPVCHLSVRKFSIRNRHPIVNRTWRSSTTYRFDFDFFSFGSKNDNCNISWLQETNTFGEFFASFYFSKPKVNDYWIYLD